MHDMAHNMDMSCFDVSLLMIYMAVYMCPADHAAKDKGVPDTWASVALPPTSKKLAGEPPCSLMMSMVAMARPAPLTMHPMLPSRPM